jgi:hypothetical protein
LSSLFISKSKSWAVLVISVIGFLAIYYLAARNRLTRDQRRGSAVARVAISLADIESIARRPGGPPRSKTQWSEESRSAALIQFGQESAVDTDFSRRKTMV